MIEPEHTILVVDDDPTLTHIVRSVLMSAGYRVLIAERGEVALEVLRKQPVDLVLLDVNMPGIGGHDVCSRIRANEATAGLPVVFVTASEDDEEIAAARKVEATDIIGKPLNYKLLIHRASHWIAAGRTLREAQAGKLRLHRALSQARLAQWEFFPTTQQFIWSPEAEEVLGIPLLESNMSVAAITRWVDARDRARVLSLIVTCKGHAMDYRLCLPDGRKLEIHQQAEVTKTSQGVPYLLGTIQDMTARRSAEKKANALAYFDRLTNLPNRAYLLEYLRDLPSEGKDAKSVALLSLNLDGFKHVNDAFGHQAGDLTLKEVARRLSDAIERTILGPRVSIKLTTPASIPPSGSGPGEHSRDQGSALLAHLGGDEFAIVMIGVNSNAELEPLISELLECVSWPVSVPGGEARVTASIGASRSLSGPTDHGQLLAEAHAARSYAKKRGVCQHQFFDVTIQARVKARVQYESALRVALAHYEVHDALPLGGREPAQLQLHYQPKYCSHSGVMAGVEALLRGSVDGQRVAPNELVDVAEESGLVGLLGEWVLRTACVAALELPGLHVAVNISPTQFLDAGFVDTVVRTLDETGLPAERLELEITEGVLINDGARCQQIIEALQGHGVSFALDDFGTGYSSLSYLTRFAVNKLKLDKSFVEGVNTARGQTVVQAILTMSENLGLVSVIEGVETQQEYEWFQSQGRVELQGYYLSRPVPLSDVQALLAQDSKRLVANE